MLIAVLILVSAAAAGVAFAAFRSVFRTPWGRAPAAAAAETIEEHTGVRRFVANRLDAEVVTGLALTAALFAAVALLAGRRRGVRARAALAGAAVGIAVAVACSRVMLDLHWTSDVVAGLALGWGWFAACAIAFGGWLLDFGAPVERAAR